MKTKPILAILLLLAGILVAQRAASHPGGVEDQIRGVEQKWNAAYAANDLPAYFAYYAEDLTQWLPEGRTDLEKYKKDWTAYISSGNKIQAVEISDLHIQIGPSQDTAVASYMLHVKTLLKDGKITEEDNQETDVWFKRNAVWKVVELHYSSAPKK